MSEDGVCGYENTTNGQPCQNPAGENGRCWIPSHNPGGDDKNPGGRPSKLDAGTTEAVYAAVGSGLKLDHVAAAAGVSPDTLRRWACCLEDLRTCTLNTDEPCEFCEGYAQAHAEGAREVLDECRPEFRASASYGYNKTEKREVTGGGGGPVEIELNETVVETGYDE